MNHSGRAISMNTLVPKHPTILLYRASLSTVKPLCQRPFARVMQDHVRMWTGHLSGQVDEAMGICTFARCIGRVDNRFESVAGFRSGRRGGMGDGGCIYSFLWAPGDTLAVLISCKIINI